MNPKHFIPILDWLPNYNSAQFKGDLTAGLTVGVMLIPQGMAYAMLAGMPPIYGLYAAILPLVLYAVFGTSRQLAVGPVAMISLLIAAGVGAIAEPGSEEFVGLAILLAMLVGAVQLLMGVFKLGFLVNFLSHPVVSGFTSAAAIIIGFSQLKHLLGISIPNSNKVLTTIQNTISNSSSTNFYTLGIGLIAIVLILLIKKFKLKFPGSLAAVIFGIVVVWLAGLNNEGVKIVGTVPQGLPAFGLPNFELSKIQSLLPIAITISFISFMQSMAIAKAIHRKHGNYKLSPNQELIALGIANIGGSMLQAFPTTGGFARTAVNDQAGAKTGMALIFSAALIVLALLFLTPLFYYLPNAILASIIIVAVIGLVDYKEAIHLWNNYRPDFWMLAATFVGTLLLGIEEGILIGVILSLAVIVFQTTKPHIASLGRIPGKPHYKNLNRFNNLEDRKEILIVRFDARLYYANVRYFLEEIEMLIAEKGKELKLFILDADAMNGMDSTGVHTLEELYKFCKSKDIEFYMVGVKGPVRDILHRTGWSEKLGEANFYIRIQHAVDSFDGKSVTDYTDYALQTNEESE
ncbi:MAG: SulP family inorganic anion transporter [Saprospiraceae bacterium]